MALSKELLSELQKKLLSEKESLKDELSRIAKPKTAPGDYDTNFNEIGTDEDDNASEVEEYADNLALENNLEKQLRDINEALVRIANGSYGKCDNCDEEISIDRLRAYPAAKTCIKC